MLISTRRMLGCTVEGVEGAAGKLEDLFFDDRGWNVAWLVVGIHGWLFRRHVLLRPAAVEQADWPDRRVQVRLSRQAVENAPDAGVHKPVSRQRRIELSELPLWTPIGGFMPVAALAHPATPRRDDPDAHLRSIREVTGYRVEATDGIVGRLAETIVNDEAAERSCWTLLSLIVETGNWLAHRKIPVAPHWVGAIDWDERKVRVNLTRRQITQSPEFRPGVPINRRIEEVLYDYHGQRRELVRHGK